MTEILSYFPGMQVTIFQTLVDAFGQRTDGYGPPVITRIIFPEFTLATGFPQTMNRLDVGLYYFQFLLPKGAAAIGAYEIEVLTTNPTTGLPNFKYFQVNVTAPFGPNSVSVANPGTPTITPIPAPPGPVGPAGGDLGGFYPSPTVIGLQGQPISTVLPIVGEVLEWNGTQWTPASIDVTLGPAAGDLSGIYPNLTVVGLQGRSVSNVAPTTGQSLAWNGTQWIPTTGEAPGGPAGGDLSGTYPNPVVAAFQTVPVSNTAPVQSAVPVYDTSGLKYNIRQLSQDDIAPGFSITGFSGGSTVEVGATVTNPTFNASYNHTPFSAQITNTDGIDSPLVLVSPFTSGTVVGAFHHTSVATVSFTLSATYTSTKTAGQSITFLARSFGGIGTAGATSATASSNTAVLVGATGTLSDEGLHGSDVGASYGPFNPTSQKIYLLLPHTSTAHTFKDQNGFTFSMNVPTTFSFTNQNGSAISMDLYESTNLLSTTFTITVVS